MQEFWNDITTEKSWKVLLELKQESFKFILIGGWAAYLWTKTHKSKDIDIVLGDFNDLNYLKENYDLKKNEHLKKYEIIIDGIDIDIYVPFYSRLAMPLEEIKKYVTRIEGISVVTPEVLLILKQGAEMQRGDSVKGSKDRIDIMALLVYSEIDFTKYEKLLEVYKLKGYNERLKRIINSFKEIKYIGLNPREFKLKKKEMLKKLK